MELYLDSGVGYRYSVKLFARRRVVRERELDGVPLLRLVVADLVPGP